MRSTSSKSIRGRQWYYTHTLTQWWIALFRVRLWVINELQPRAFSRVILYRSGERCRHLEKRMQSDWGVKVQQGYIISHMSVRALLSPMWWPNSICLVSTIFRTESPMLYVKHVEAPTHQLKLKTCNTIGTDEMSPLLPISLGLRQQWRLRDWILGHVETSVRFLRVDAMVK